MFPVPLTILMLRNQKLDKRARYAIIAIAWIVYLLYVWGANVSNADETPTVDQSSTPVITETVSQNAETNTVSEDKAVDSSKDK